MRNLLFFLQGMAAFFGSYGLVYYFDGGAFAGFLTGWGVGGAVAIIEGHSYD